MNLGEIRQFVEGRLPGGLGVKDAQALAALDGAKPKQVARVAGEYASKFTTRGAETFEQLTGSKLELRAGESGRGGGATAVDVMAGRSSSLPRAWKQVSHVADKMKELIDEGESVNLRLKSGRMVSMEASEQMTEFVKKGYFKLYKNEKDSSQPDDETGRPIYSAGYYLVPTPAFKMLDDALEKHLRKADSITKNITDALEKLRTTMHASRVNGLSDFNLPQIKREVAAEIPKAKAAIIAYEAAVEKFAQDTQHLDYPNSEVYLMLFAKKALEVAGPRIEASSMRELASTKDLIRANEMLLSRPEVEAVDPGFGIRIQVNTDTLVKNGGDYNAAKAEMTKMLRDALITGELNFDKNNNEDKLLDAAQAVLRRAVGAAKVGGWQLGDKDFPDGVRGTEVILYVKKDALAEAKKHAAEIKALFAPHGLDMKHFSLKIEEDYN